MDPRPPNWDCFLRLSCLWTSGPVVTSMVYIETFLEWIGHIGELAGRIHGHRHGLLPGLSCLWTSRPRGDVDVYIETLPSSRFLENSASPHRRTAGRSTATDAGSIPVAIVPMDVQARCA